LSSSNETRKPAGRPSLLSAEQQNALENQPASLAAIEAPVAEAPRRKHLWVAGGVSVLVVAIAVAFMSFGASEPAADALVAAPAPATAPAAAPVPAPAPAAPVAAQTAPPAPADASPLAALTASTPQVAAIIDEAPPPVAAKPKESLKQMLESGTPAATKPVAASVRKPAKEKPRKESEPEATAPSAEEENDVQLLAALVAHAKYDTSANARLSLSKALDQCKKQGKQDAARCRIRVCEGRWKKNECRAYSRSKLEKTASGA